MLEKGAWSYSSYCWLQRLFPLLPGMGWMMKKTKRNQGTTTTKKIGEYEENNMNNKIKLCWQSCRKRDEHALSKFLAGTVQLPADAEKPTFRFMVKRDWTTSPGQLSSDFPNAYVDCSGWEQVSIRRAFNSTMNSAMQYLKPDLICCLQDYPGSGYAAYLG